MTNKEWLDYLAHNAPDELSAWFDAEHVETEERALDGDTEPENADSRERLEAEIESHSAFDIMDTITLDMVIGWLDRQAAIKAHQWESYHNGMMLEWMAKTEELQAQVDELTAERDKWKSCWEKCKAQSDAILAEREQYRKLFGMALDWAHEITMLESSIDEGMA